MNLLLALFLSFLSFPAFCDIDRFDFLIKGAQERVIQQTIFLCEKDKDDQCLDKLKVELAKSPSVIPLSFVDGFHESHEKESLVDLHQKIIGKKPNLIFQSHKWLSNNKSDSLMVARSPSGFEEINKLLYRLRFDEGLHKKISKVIVLSRTTINGIVSAASYSAGKGNLIYHYLSMGLLTGSLSGSFQYFNNEFLSIINTNWGWEKSKLVFFEKILKSQYQEKIKKSNMLWKNSKYFMWEVFFEAMIAFTEYSFLPSAVGSEPVEIIKNVLLTSLMVVGGQGTFDIGTAVSRDLKTELTLKQIDFKNPHFHLDVSQYISSYKVRADVMSALGSVISVGGAVASLAHVGNDFLGIGVGKTILIGLGMTGLVRIIWWKPWFQEFLPSKLRSRLTCSQHY